MRRGTHCAPAASVQTTTASQLTKRVCPAAHPPPAPCAPQAHPEGVGANNRVAFLLGTFLCFAKETYPKRRPCCLRPLRFAAGQPGVLVRGVRRGTHCAPAALRSNNHGESVDEAGVSCGTPATPRPARLRRIQKGWGANNRVAFLLGTFLCFAKETYPKATCCLRPLRFAAGQPGVLVRGCAVELTARLRRSVQTTTASQLTKRVCPAAHPPPAPCAPQAHPEGVGSKQQGRLSFGYVSLLRQNVPKGDPAICDPFASLRGNLGCSCAGCAVELTARLRLRSNNHGESVDEAGVSCGTPATRALRASGASQRGGEQTTGSPFFWVRFFASPKRTQGDPAVCDPFLRCGATWGARARGAPWNSLRACGAPFKQPRRVS